MDTSVELHRMPRLDELSAPPTFGGEPLRDFDDVAYLDDERAAIELRRQTTHVQAPQPVPLP